MQWFINLSTRSKLIGGFGLMVLLLVAVAGVAQYGITQIQASQQRLYQEYFADALDLMTLRTHENAVRLAVVSMIMVDDPSERAQHHQEVRARSRAIGDLFHDLLERSRDDGRRTRQLQEMELLRSAFIETRDAEILPLIDAGRLEQARALALGIQEQRHARIRAIAEELGEAAVQHAGTAVAESQRLANEATRVFALAGAVTVLAALALALWLARIVAAPLSDIANVARRVAAGDLRTRIADDGRTDEIGALRNAFREMIDSLGSTTRQILEGVNVLASSSNEILATTSQVGAGATQTATAVSETTATVEEVKQTAQLASQKARRVSDTAQNTVQVAEDGRRAVDQAIEDMNRIREQMESVAEGVIRLSEQGQAIGEIIATVNDLAEQSNLLAVNAAIEATKAGEQGKGFAVVAQEVKSLAEQSKQATAQVRRILGDVQKATTAAVLAAEQGHKAVEAGARQSALAGESIRRLADSIAEAAQAATQIAASSQQQMVGMDQVAQAMDNIQQASHQNVAGARQAETAAQDLHELGQRLATMAGARA